ncbi:MAG TPA: aromatic amino acid ammonia-lyase [Candidatus Acidoferrales bacterium]|nr:aromatic amino acid ammonia-lyase [Candidatus Acidoferrales bacterium]
MANGSATIKVSGDGLTIEQVVAVARARARVELSDEPEVRRRILASRRFLEQTIERGEVIYGVNTGFGGNVRFLLPKEELAEHQEDIFRFLVCGTGPPLPEDAVRAAILLRANALAKGYSAVRVPIIESLLELLNRGITPVVPRHGSVGASGDLIPSAHIGQVLLGRGEVFYNGARIPVADALQRAGLEPITLAVKEGLALVNGTTVMTGVGALALHDGKDLLPLVLACATLSLEAVRGSDDPFHDTVQKVKHHPGQSAVASICRDLLEGSRYVRNLHNMRLGKDQPQETRREDAIQTCYSLRCVPQGLGPAWEALREHRLCLEREINSANDNPLVDPDDGHVYHTGNFYGGHVARALDSWKIDLVTMGNWLHSLMALLVDDRFNNGLPPNLVRNPGRSSGFKGMQLCLTSLVSAMRHLAGPSMIHSLATEQYNQDVVSLGYHSALTAMEMTELLRDATAITLVTACQAIDLRGGKDGLGAGDRKLYEAIRSRVAFLEQDRPMDRDIAAAREMIQSRLLPVPQP